MWFFAIVIKILGNNFRNFISSGSCHVTIIWWVVYKKSMIFEDFWEYLDEFVLFLREIFFGSKILSSCDKHWKNIMDVLVSLALKSRFLTIWGIFGAPQMILSCQKEQMLLTVNCEH